MRVSSADFIKNYGSVTDAALTEPVTITRNGRDRLVLVSVEEYARLKRRDRRAVAIDQVSAEDIRLIESSLMEPGHEHLDSEMGDGRR